MKNLNLKILKNKEIAPGHFVMNLRSEYVAQKAKPGQFIHVRIKDEEGSPFLRRPFSIHDVLNKNTFQVLYEVVGKGTEILSAYKKGDTLDVIAPLGNGFKIDKDKNNLLVAGGMGFAPLLFLARKIKEMKLAKKTIVFLGARSETDLIRRKEFARLGLEIILCTEDASCGAKGLVTDVLSNFLKENPELQKESLIFGCGPNAMLKALIDVGRSFNMESQVSVEEVFACGLGACLGCAVKANDGGYKLACKDGPVFRGDEIIL